MQTSERVYSRTSFAAGAGALLLAGFWFLRSWGDGVEIVPVPSDIADLNALFSLWLTAILFDFGVPLLCLVALVSGLIACKHAVSKIGLSLASAGLLLYLVVLQSCTATLF